MKNILISSTYFKINSKLARVLGMRESILISYLYEALQDARKNDRVVYIEGLEYFAISRTDIVGSTTISTSSQRRIEKKLEQRGVLEVVIPSARNAVYFRIDEDVLEHLLIQKEE